MYGLMLRSHLGTAGSPERQSETRGGLGFPALWLLPALGLTCVPKRRFGGVSQAFVVLLTAEAYHRHRGSAECRRREIAEPQYAYHERSYVHAFLGLTILNTGVCEN